MGKVELNKQRKRTSLLDAALELFTQKGLESTSISDIVSRSGVAKGTFYLYFKDKYDIRNKLIIYQSQHLLKEAYLAMLEQDCPTLEDQFVCIADHVLDQLERRKELLILISKNLSWGILKQTMFETEQEDMAFVEDFRGLTEPHGIYPPQSEILLYLLVELVGAACYNAILYAEPCDLATLKPYLFESVRRIVRQFLEQARGDNIPAASI